jgi:hypothetical protein
MAAPVSVQVEGNVEGSIVVGDHNFVVNHNHGTIFYKQAAPQVRLREMKPRPPRPPRIFLDRQQEFAQLEAWIGRNEIAVIHAADGMGKSSLLRQAANTQAAAALPDGVLLLEGLDAEGRALSAADILQRLFDALFESDPPLKVNEASARTYLSNTRPLVLLDEVSLSPQLKTLLPDLFPQACVLLAADAPPGGNFLRLPLPPLPRSDSLHLLAEKAGLAVDDSNRRTLESVCALLADLPLALIVTGNVLREAKMTPVAAFEALRAIANVSADPLQAALDRAFVLAFSRLTSAEQKILSAAAFTPGVSMTPEWLAAVLGNVDVSQPIERLKSLELLHANSPRLRLPAGLRRPARQAGARLLDEKALLRRLAEFLLRRFSSNPFDLQALGEELGNLFGALRAASASGDWQTALRLARLLDPCLTLRGLWDAWDGVLRVALQAARSLGDRPAEAWALHQLGTRLVGMGDLTGAVQFLRSALDLRIRLGDLTGAAYTRHNLSLLVPPAPPSGRSAPRPHPARGPSPLKWLLVAGGAFAFLGALIAAGIFLLGLLFEPPARPAISSVEADITYLVYGPGAETCGDISTGVRVSLNDPEAVPWAHYQYWRGGSPASTWYDLPLEPLAPALYAGEVDTRYASDELQGDSGWMLIEAGAGEDTAKLEIIVAYEECGLSMDVDGPFVGEMFFDPSPSFYGPDAPKCGPNLLTLSLAAEDPSGIAYVIVRYRYEYENALIGEWYEIAMAPISPSFFLAEIDHNFEERAKHTLDNLDGFLRWEATAVDGAGNETVVEGPLAPVHFADCYPARR